MRKPSLELGQLVQFQNQRPPSFTVPGVADPEQQGKVGGILLPDESRTTSRLADEMRRLLERAIKDIRDNPKGARLEKVI